MMSEWGLAVAVNSGRPLAVAVKAQRGVNGSGRPESLYRAPGADTQVMAPEWCEATATVTLAASEL